jgi:hypothetical protein
MADEDNVEIIEEEVNRNKQGAEQAKALDSVTDNVRPGAATAVALLPHDQINSACDGR